MENIPLSAVGRTLAFRAEGLGSSAFRIMVSRLSKAANIAFGIGIRGDGRGFSLGTRLGISAPLPVRFRPSPTRRSTTEDLFRRRRSTEALQPSNRRTGPLRPSAVDRVFGVAPLLDCRLRVAGIFALGIERLARKARNYQSVPVVDVSVRRL